MQAMLVSTLAYLRGDADPDPRQVANVASVLVSIADASSDAGRDVSYAGPGRALATVRPFALRRALDNVVDNVVRYGTRALISLARAFEPFTLLEASRNRNTGGTGLGPTICRRIVEAERGTIAMANRPEGGLRVRISLPRAGR